MAKKSNETAIPKKILDTITSHHKARKKSALAECKRAMKDAEIACAGLKDIVKHNRNLASYLATTVKVNRKFGTILISHNGNMGDGLDTVRHNIDQMFGKGSLAKFRRIGNILEEEGHPSYMYRLIIQF